MSFVGVFYTLIFPLRSPLKVQKVNVDYGKKRETCDLGEESVDTHTSILVPGCLSSELGIRCFGRSGFGVVIGGVRDRDSLLL